MKFIPPVQFDEKNQREKKLESSINDVRKSSTIHKSQKEITNR